VYTAIGKCGIHCVLGGDIQESLDNGLNIACSGKFHVKLQYVVSFAYSLLLYWEALSVSGIVERRRIR
jgi:hypothetical protein